MPTAFFCGLRAADRIHLKPSFSSKLGFFNATVVCRRMPTTLSRLGSRSHRYTSCGSRFGDRSYRGGAGQHIPQKFPPFFMDCKNCNFGIFCRLESADRIHLKPSFSSKLGFHRRGLCHVDAHGNLHSLSLAAKSENLKRNDR